MLSNIRIGRTTSSGCSPLLDSAKREMTIKELEEYKRLNPKGKSKLIDDKNLLSASAMNYIKDKNKEFKLKRRLEKDDSGKAALWGKLVESWLMNERPEIIGYEHTLTPNITTIHPIYNFHCGSRDGFNNLTNAVDDIKCPYTLESYSEFAELHEKISLANANVTDALINGIDYEGINYYHKDGYKYYCQLLSNACIAGVNRAELIIFIPTIEQLDNIKQYASDGDLENYQDYYYIAMANNESLPYLPLDAEYSNKIVFNLTFTAEEIEHFNNKIKLAGNYLLINK